MSQAIQKHHVAGIERVRKQASSALSRENRGLNGQFLTPAPIAEFMASLFDEFEGKTVRILEPGAGVGSLIAAYATHISRLHAKPKSVEVVAYEIEPVFLGELKATLDDCKRLFHEVGIPFLAEVRPVDFLEDASAMLEPGLFGARCQEDYDQVLMNPPYRKIAQDSRERALVQRTGVRVGNLYTAFVTLAIQLLRDNGQLVAITPRSFCNGPYFKDFRRFLLESVSLERIHEFASRSDQFKDDEVLQETVIFSARKSRASSKTVLVSSSPKSDLGDIRLQVRKQTEIVHPGEPNLFIHLPSHEDNVALTIRSLPARLEDLGLSVSTGRVVDFRAKQHLRQIPDDSCAPLIYPLHLRERVVNWPVLDSKKPNGLRICEETENLLVPTVRYVLVKRFSSKEERKRIAATVFEPDSIPCELVALENHLNYFHQNHRGLPKFLAWGLAGYLNSSLVDSFFRQFNGHTQVNATDLRSLRYPSERQLVEIGSKIGVRSDSQEELDSVVELVLGQHA